MKAGQCCEALRGAGSSSGRPLQAARRLQAGLNIQQRPNRRWRTRTSLRSTATRGCMLRRLIRTRPKCRSTHQRLSSMHRWLNTINLAAARRSPGAGGHASCPHPCTRTSSRASSDFILFRRASNARALPPSAPADRALTIHWPVLRVRRPDRATTPPTCRATPARPRGMQDGGGRQHWVECHACGPLGQACATCDSVQPPPAWPHTQ